MVGVSNSECVICTLLAYNLPLKPKAPADKAAMLKKDLLFCAIVNFLLMYNKGINKNNSLKNFKFKVLIKL
jgi:hypothetical protein